MKKLLLILMLAIAPLAFAQGPTQTVSSTALEASHVIKSGPGDLILFMGYNSGSEQFIQVHNAASLPANAAVPVVSFKVSSGQNFSLAIPSDGMRFTTGIVVCNSSTAATKTIGAADCLFNAVIK
jgi:hypothetical protein